MTDILCKVSIIIFYILILLLIPLFLDLLFEITVRKNRKSQIEKIARNKSLKIGKPVISFHNRYNGTIIDNSTNKKETFSGDIMDIVTELETNSCIIVLSRVLEYMDGDQNILWLLSELKRISGGEIYIMAIEKNSPRILWDYKINNVVDKSYYLPGEEIKWKSPNNLHLKAQKIYGCIFKLFPQNFII